MVIATRIFNLMSGVLVLVTGLYIELMLDHVWSDGFRWLVVGVSVIYFVVQFGLQVIRPVYAGKTADGRPSGRQFSS